jgi:tRNA-dependent cyclodipeptide synthase
MTMQLKPTKYRIKVAQVMPAHALPRLFDQPRCVLGVSMTNPIFWRSSLRALLGWMREHFAEPLVLVGDHLHRLNEQLLHGYGEAEASEAARQEGDRFMAHLEACLAGFPEQSFQVMRWQPFHQDPAFAQAKAQLWALYEENAAVRASIDSTAALFVWQKQGRAPLAADKETAVRLSAEYLLEEMAVFSVLIDRGWEVVLYPGAQLPMLMEIATGRFRDVPHSLHKGIYVELNVAKK